MCKQVRWLTAILLLGAVWAAAGCFLQRSGAPQPYRETRLLMDTVIEITAYGTEAEAAVRAALAEFEHVQAVCDRFNPGSQVAKINQAAGSGNVTVEPLLLDLVNQAKALSPQTDGAFDISVGPLTALWNVGNKGDYVPSAAEIAAVLPLIGYERITVDAAAHTVALADHGMSLDLGGIAKGVAINRAFDILTSRNIRSALINAGGDIRVIGRKPDGTPWRIGIQDPRNPDKMIAKIALQEWDTLTTSGDYQRYFIKDGIRYAHILDPQTGLPPREVASVTLVYNCRQRGFVPSAAFQILGVERGLSVLKRFPGVEAVFVATDGRIVTSPGLEGKIELLQEK